jgi:hypothetical protein
VLRRPLETTAQSGHSSRAQQCPLLGVKRTSPAQAARPSFSELSGVLEKQSRCSLGDRFVPHIVPRDDFSCEESWSEWQDLNLRPPRPERGALCTFGPQRNDSPLVFEFIKIISPRLHHSDALRPKFGSVHVSSPNIVRFLVS